MLFRAGHSRTACVLAAVFLALSVGHGFAARAEALSAAARQPDGWIRFLGSYNPTAIIAGGLPTPWKGKNIYNTTGKSQTSKADDFGTSPVGTYYLFQVALQNDGTSSDRIKVRATGPGVLSDWTLYWHDELLVTDEVIAGTYKTATLAPAAKDFLTVWVLLEEMPSAEPAILLTLTSVGDTTRKDAVKVKIVHVSCGC